MAEIGEVFKPGQKVPHSGIYDVIHDPAHRTKHQVTCIYNKTFPPCAGCKSGVRFKLHAKAIHIAEQETFK